MNNVYVTRAELNQLLRKLSANVVPHIMMAGKIDSPSQVIYLSERNVKALLSKLDRAAQGEQTYCTIIKQDTSNKRFPCSMEASITAVESGQLKATFATEVLAVNDLEYYDGREAGLMHPADEVKL